MLKEKQRSVKSCIGLVLAFVLLLSLVKIPVLAARDSKFIIDPANVLTDEEYQAIDEVLTDMQEETEIVTVFLTGETLFAPEQLEQMAADLTAKNGYKAINEEEGGSVFLFVNKSSGGVVTTAVVPTGREAYNYTGYQTAYMVKVLEGYYRENPSMEMLIDQFINLVRIYYYPVINELSDGSIVDVGEASKEIAAWREYANQDILILLNDSLNAAEFNQYADDYFLSQGYGIGEEQSGTFVLYSPNLGQLAVNFYGEAYKDYPQADMDNLADELLGILERNNDVLEVVYQIERFIDPEADIPLAEGAIDKAEQAMFINDRWEILEDKQAGHLEALSFHYMDQFSEKLYQTIILPDGENNLTEADLKEWAQNEFEYHDVEDGMLTLFDAQAQKVVWYAAGSTESFWKKNAKMIEPVQKALEKELKQSGYDADAIFNYQAGMLELLTYLRQRETNEPNILDTAYAFINDKLPKQIQELEKAGLTPVLISQNHISAYADGKAYLKWYKDLMKKAGLADNMLVFLYQSETEELDLMYFGQEEVAAAVFDKMKPEIMDFFLANSADATAEEFLSQLKTKVVPVMKNESSSENKPDKKDTSAKDEKNNQKDGKEPAKSSGNNMLIIIVAGVIILLVLLIVIALVAGRKKKAPAQPVGPHPAAYPGMQPGGYPAGPANNNYSAPAGNTSYIGAPAPMGNGAGFGGAPTPMDNSAGFGGAPIPMDNGAGFGGAPTPMDNGVGYGGAPTAMDNGAGFGGAPTPLDNGAGFGGAPTPMDNGAGFGGVPTPMDNGAGYGGVPTPLDNGAGYGGAPTPLDNGAGFGGVPTPMDNGAGFGGVPTPLDNGAGFGGEPTPLDKGAGFGGAPTPMDNGAGYGGAPTPLDNGVGFGEVPTPMDNGTGYGGAPTALDNGVGFGEAPTAMDNTGMSGGVETPVQADNLDAGAEKIGGNEAEAAEKNSDASKHPENENTAAQAESQEIPVNTGGYMGYSQTPAWPDNTGYSGNASGGWSAAPGQTDTPVQNQPYPPTPAAPYGQDFGQAQPMPGYGQPYPDNNQGYGQGYQQPGYGQGYPAYNQPNQGFNGYSGQNPNPQNLDGGYPTANVWGEQKPQN